MTDASLDWTCQIGCGRPGIWASGVSPLRWVAAGQETSSADEGISQKSVPDGIPLTRRLAVSAVNVRSPNQLVSPGLSVCRPMAEAIAKSPREVPLVLRVNEEEPIYKKPPAAT